MSTRAIAPIVGTSHMQVKRDIDAGVTNVTPEPNPIASVEPDTGYWSPESGFDSNPLTGEIIEAPVTVTETHTIKTVTGLDGKTYRHRPERPGYSSLGTRSRPPRSSGCSHVPGLPYRLTRPHSGHAHTTAPCSASALILTRHRGQFGVSRS
jgi:hypothetical protein